MEIAVISNGAIPLNDFAFIWRACEIQRTRDFLPAWRGHLPIPESENWPIAGYENVKHLTPGSYHPIVCVVGMGDGNSGDHSGIAATKTAFGRWLPHPRVASHECLELAADPFCNIWKPYGDDGSAEALEIADRVQEDFYVITATIAGISRDIEVSNFLYPAAFGIGTGTQYDHMNLLRSPQENRGYAIVRRPDGAVENVFASTMSVTKRREIDAKAMEPLSRTAQRIVQVAGEAASRASAATTEMMRKRKS